ncbi:MAG: hypothetical protein NVSMB27_29810 [Ktedonobacteraceae bacterium]
MKTMVVEPAYEPLRTWALHPSSLRPPGLAQFLRGGMVTWLQTAQSLLVPPLQEGSLTQRTSQASTPLSTLVAAMIREVCP